MEESLLQEDFNCDECGATFSLHHNEINDVSFCPFCKCEMLILIDKDEDAPWADLEDEDDDLEDGDNDD